MCFGGGKKKGPSNQDYVAMDMINKQNAALMETRQQLASAQQATADSTKAFQDTQSAYLQQVADATKAASDREAVQFEQTRQASVAAGQAAALPQLVQANNGADTGEEGDALDSQKKGRRALRIDLQATSGGASGNGLNVPRG